MKVPATLPKSVRQGVAEPAIVHAHTEPVHFVKGAQRNSINLMQASYRRSLFELLRRARTTSWLEASQNTWPSGSAIALVTRHPCTTSFRTLTTRWISSIMVSVSIIYAQCNDEPGSSGFGAGIREGGQGSLPCDISRSHVLRCLAREHPHQNKSIISQVHFHPCAYHSG